MKKPDFDKSKLPQVMDIIDKAACLMAEKDCNNDIRAKEELSILQKQLEDITGNNKIEITDFRRYWSYTSLEEIAKRALIMPPPKEELSDGQIREIILNLLADNEEETSEAEMDYWIEYLAVNTGLENLSDYIFYPGLAGLSEDASLEEITDKIIMDRVKDN